MEEDAGSGRLSDPDAGNYTASGSPSRISRRRLIVIAAALAVAIGGVGAGGYASLRAQEHQQAAARFAAAAISAAKACVAATQPSDVGALPATERALEECSTGDFKNQMNLYGAVLSEAYQAVNLRVRLPDIDAAVEHAADDGSVVALLAFHTTISQDGVPDRANSYRIRVTMVPEGGQYKMSRLEQVAR
jgi:Mce-associated membrane protein